MTKSPAPSLDDLGDLDSPELHEQSEGFKSLPFGATSEAWEATKRMRLYYAKLRSIETEHQREHGCKYPCVRLADTYQTQAWVMTEIKKACLPPQNYYEVEAQKKQLLSLLEQGTLKPDTYILEALGLEIDDAANDLVATDKEPK